MSYLDNFYYQLYGPEHGRRWVFLHGLMGFSQNWRKIIMGLEKTERCLSYDQRGHGRSFKPDQGYGPEDYADDLLKILDALNWQKIILVGHSMGGRNALNFTFRYPERVEKFVLVDISPDVSPDGAKYFEDLLNLVPTPFVNRAAAREYFQGEFLQKAKTREKVEVIGQYFYANIIDLPDGRADWRFSKEAVLASARSARTTDRWHELSGLKVPTLLLRGQNSLDLPESVFEKMLKSNSLIQGVTIPGAGHWVHSDRPELFLEAVQNFVGGF